MSTDDEELRPFMWLVFYFIGNIILLSGKKVFWPFNLLLGTISTLILFIYLIGSLPAVNFNKHARYDDDPGGASSSDSKWFVGGIHQALKYFPIAAWPYVGIEAVAFASDEISRPKKVSNM